MLLLQLTLTFLTGVIAVFGIQKDLLSSQTNEKKRAKHVMLLLSVFTLGTMASQYYADHQAIEEKNALSNSISTLSGGNMELKAQNKILSDSLNSKTTSINWNLQSSAEETRKRLTETTNGLLTAVALSKDAIKNLQKASLSNLIGSMKPPIVQVWLDNAPNEIEKIRVIFRLINRDSIPVRVVAGNSLVYKNVKTSAQPPDSFIEFNASDIGPNTSKIVHTDYFLKSLGVVRYTFEYYNQYFNYRFIFDLVPDGLYQKVSWFKLIKYSKGDEIGKAVANNNLIMIGGMSIRAPKSVDLSKFDNIIKYPIN